MNLPKIVKDFINAQNSHDSVAYTQCFDQTAFVFDEGKKHTGKDEIQFG
jgi:hypothetical protein